MVKTKKEGKFFSLSSKLALLVAISVILVGVSLLGYAYFSLEDLGENLSAEIIPGLKRMEEMKLTSNLKTKSEELLNQYASDELFVLLPEDLEKKFEALKSVSGFEYVILKDEEENILYSDAVMNALKEKLTDVDFFSEKKPGSKGSFIIKTKLGRFIEMSKPIGGIKSGRLVFGFSLTDIDSKIALFEKDASIKNLVDITNQLAINKVRNIEIYGFILALGIFIFSLIVTSYFAKRIIKPLKVLETTMSSIEMEHDLTKKVEVGTNDEIERVSNVMNNMIGRLADLVVKVQNASLQMASCSNELLAASEQIAKGAKNQARSIEDASSAVTELTASVQQVSDNADRAAVTSKEGGAAVSEVVSTMDNIKNTVSKTSEKIKTLGEHSKEIGKIVNVITQISDQTSLLALNAAIEAARAGEQGRGFAVVADEISKLAVKASKSAKEIDELITDIKNKTEETVISMEEGYKIVENGTGLINKTGKSFIEISELVQETASAVKEQAVAFNEISNSMNEVMSIAKETVTAADEAVVQGNDLRELADKLEELIQMFKV